MRTCRWRHTRRRAGVAALGALVAACGAPPAGPVTWEGEYPAAALLAPGATLVLTDRGQPAVAPPPTLTRWPDDTLACPGSFVAARLRGDTTLVAWRTRLADGTTQLMLAATGDGGVHYARGERVASPAGGTCGWARPSVAGDARTGRAHVAYVIEDGARRGVWLASGDVVHPFAPSGARPVANGAVAGRVALAFAQPGTGESRIQLALVNQWRQIPPVVLPVSPPALRSGAPAVAMLGSRIAVAWNVAAHGDLPPSAVARVGRIQW